MIVPEWMCQEDNAEHGEMEHLQDLSGAAERALVTIFTTQRLQWLSTRTDAIHAQHTVPFRADADPLPPRLVQSMLLDRCAALVCSWGVPKHNKPPFPTRA